MFQEKFYIKILKKDIQRNVYHKLYRKITCTKINNYTIKLSSVMVFYRYLCLVTTVIKAYHLVVRLLKNIEMVNPKFIKAVEENI